MAQQLVFDEQFWNERWKTDQTPWDMSKASPALMTFAAAVLDKNIAILIPGCGNAYEAEALWDMGFRNITLLDISAELVHRLKEKLQAKEGINVVHADFFDLKGQYDLILEQTFFCALDPSLRQAYADKMATLLNPNGILAGVLFQREFELAGPPFGGSREEYEGYFGKLFVIETMEPCYNSIAPRAGSELFIKLKKI